MDQGCGTGEGAQEYEKQQLLSGAEIELAQTAKILRHIIGIDDLQLRQIEVFFCLSQRRGRCVGIDAGILQNCELPLLGADRLH